MNLWNWLFFSVLSNPPIILRKFIGTFSKFAESFWVTDAAFPSQMGKSHTQRKSKLPSSVNTLIMHLMTTFVQDRCTKNSHWTDYLETCPDEDNVCLL